MSNLSKNTHTKKKKKKEEEKVRTKKANVGLEEKRQQIILITFC